MLNSKFLSTALLIIAACFVSSACTGEEEAIGHKANTTGKANTPTNDENNSGGMAKAENACITTADGSMLHILSNGCETFYFGEDGLPTGFLDSWEDHCTISYNPMQIRDDYDEIYNVTLNDDGYISEWKSDYVDEWDGTIYYTGTEFEKNTYDEEGYIINSTGYLIEEEMMNGEPTGNKTVHNITMEYIWENGNLTRIDTKWDYTGDGKNIEGNDTQTFIYGNNALRNTTGQFSHGLSMMSGSFCELTFMGYYGKPSAYFPTQVIDKYQDPDDYGTPNFNKERTYSYTYSFNADGTINWETGGRWGIDNEERTFYYQYAKAPVVSGIQPIFRSQPKQRKQKRRHSRLRHFRH